MASDELTKALLLDEVCERRAVAEALFASVSGNVPLLQALVESRAASASTLGRYLERREAPFIKHVVPAVELVDRLPPGLCGRLLAVPVAHDPSSGTVEVAVADPGDPHPANEIGYHLGAPIRVVRASIGSLEEALRRLRMRPGDARLRGEPGQRRRTLQPPEPQLTQRRRGGLVIEEDSVPPPAKAPQRIRTPPWGTLAHGAGADDSARANEASDIPIPLTRKTFRPPAVTRGTGHQASNPNDAGLGEGYSFDTTGFRDVVERQAPQPEARGAGYPTGFDSSFIPGPPPLPGAWTRRARENEPSGRVAFPEMTGVLSALRSAGSRDEILELVLTGARIVTPRVALFVVKKGGYLGWVSSPEFADRTALQSILIPLDSSSVFDRAIREDLYVGLVRNDHIHAPLLRAMRNVECELAIVPLRVSGKTAALIVAAELASPTIGTRRLEDLSRAGGEAFARIVRTRR